MRSVLCFLICLLGSPLTAQEITTQLYDVQLIGAKIGEISISGTRQNDRYTARSHFTTTGVVGMLKRLHANLSVNGRITEGAPFPDDYAEAIDNGRRVTNVKVRFGGNAPKLVSGETGSSAAPADTSALLDALDPLTALYILLRDQPAGTLCTFRSNIFDGHRHARIALDTPDRTGEKIACSGDYRRIAGYSSSEKKRDRIPITIEYEPAGAVMRASRIQVNTRFGRAVMLRR